MKTEIDIKRVIYRTFPLPTHTETNRASDSLIYYTNGGHRFEFENQTLVATEGNMVYLPYKSAYKNYTQIEGTEYYQIDFLISDGEEPKPLFDGPIVFEKNYSLQFFSLFKDICEKSAQTNTTYNMYCSLALLKIITKITHSEQHISKVDEKRQKIERTLDYINQYYYLNTSLEELAQMSFMSVSNLEKLFKNVYGLSPVSYRLKVRIDQAKLLLAGGYSVAETATKVGFSDIYYFCKIFKRQCGDTPGKFSRKNSKI